MPDDNGKKEVGPGRAAFISAIFALFVVFLGFGGWVVEYLLVSDPISTELVLRNFAAIIGLPMAAIGAFIVVVFLRQTHEGPIEFEGLGFRFRGASGPVVLWLVCFLAIAGAIKLLWVP